MPVPVVPVFVPEGLVGLFRGRAEGGVRGEEGGGSKRGDGGKRRRRRRKRIDEWPFRFLNIFSLPHLLRRCTRCRAHRPDIGPRHEPRRASPHTGYVASRNRQRVEVDALAREQRPSVGHRLGHGLDQRLGARADAHLERACSLWGAERGGGSGRAVRLELLSPFTKRQNERVISRDYHFFLSSSSLLFRAPFQKKDHARLRDGGRPTARPPRAGRPHGERRAGGSRRWRERRSCCFLGGISLRRFVGVGVVVIVIFVRVVAAPRGIDLVSLRRCGHVECWRHPRQGKCEGEEGKGGK